MKNGAVARMSGTVAAVVVALAWVAVAPAALWASDQEDARRLVTRSQGVLETFSRHRDMDVFRDLMKRAHGLFIAPEVLKGAFIVGGSGGSGVFLAREPKGGWHGPAFYTLGSVNIGLQIGGESSQVVLLAMTERGLTAMLSTNVKLGGDVGIAAGPVGGGAAAATANVSADLVSFSISRGAFAGIALDGAVVAVREGLNTAYYGKSVSPTDILVRHSVSNPRARGLLDQASQLSSGKR